jgi:hypothetical protein
MHFRVNQLMASAQETKAIVRQHLSGTNVESTFKDRPPYLALMNHLDPARSPMCLAQEAMLRPVKPRGVLPQDVPAQATKCFFLFKVPQSFHTFYFKVQRAWKKEEQLEKDLVRMWQEMYKEAPETFAIKALGANVEPGMPDAVYCAKTPKANREQREARRHYVTNEPHLSLLNEQVRRERIRQNRERAEEERNLARQTDYFRVHPRDAGPDARRRRRIEAQNFRLHGQHIPWTEEQWL